MSDTTKLLNTLKKYLKAKNITYRELAKALDLSEASVKRLFSEQSFSLKRLEEICKILDLEFYDLARMSKLNDAQDSNPLTTEQEMELANNPKLLTILYLLISGWSTSLIRAEYEISDIVKIISRGNDITRCNYARMRPAQLTRGLPYGFTNFCHINENS